MNLTSVGDTDLAPLGVIEGVELTELVLDDAGRVEVAGKRLVVTAAARATTWVVFTRHRITCVGGVDPALCGCAPNEDDFHAYLAGPSVDGAVPVRPDPEAPA